ncbi:MAG: beta-lactamase family protein [Acidobacteria bacterium]|nr:beta-lactamase family protein [Acidobacteriota bacterium]
MWPFRRLASALPLLIVFSTIALAQQIDVHRNIPLIEKMIAEEMEKNSVPGLSVAIALNGKVVYEKGFGFADLEQKVPFTPQTVSRIGSISKTFTALSVMQLVEQGKIKLDDEVQTYVPTFPRKSAPITIRQLLGHQGGIRHYKGNEMLSNVHYDDVESALAIFKDDPLVNEPGEKYSYSTYGFNLLSRVVEVTSGETFLDYLNKHIISPLGLKQTYPDRPPNLIPLRARNYTKTRSGPLENAPAVDQSNKWGGGGLLSTVEDLIKYAASYDGNTLAKPETIKLMFTAQNTRDGKPTAYGFGWALANDQGKRRVEHSGGSIGATAILTKYPEQGLIIAALVNCDHYGAAQFKTRIAKILLEAQSSTR